MIDDLAALGADEVTAHGRGHAAGARGLRASSRRSAFPETIQHDDLHDGQVFVQDGRYLLLDWGDACVSHPFFTLAVTLDGVIAWGVDDVEHSEDTEPYRDAYLAAVPRPTTRRSRRRRDDRADASAGSAAPSTATRAARRTTSRRSRGCGCSSTAGVAMGRSPATG